MSRQIRQITVDLTPVLPGGNNGGAKILALTLARELGAMLPNTELVLLTSAVSHAELADLDAHNVRRQCVDTDLASDFAQRGALSKARGTTRFLIDALVPPSARTSLKDGIWRRIKQQRRAQATQSLLADVHFAPFTAPFFFDPRVPLVAIVHDVQFLDHPELFDEQTRASRSRHFLDACERADRVVCVSEFVRQSVLSHAPVAPQAVQTIHTTVLHSITRDPDAQSISHKVLAELGLASRRYLLYPGNAWPHKNHRLLIEAFADYVNARPQSDLALVCTGAPGVAFEELNSFARARLPAGRFAVAGFLPERQFAALLQMCCALIFPSLYEGFGMPVLEAMASDRPVLCSNASSLPEIVGDAAILFDPRGAASITAAIARLEDEPELAPTLVERGRRRVAEFGSVRELAAKYLDAFEGVIASRERSRIGRG